MDTVESLQADVAALKAMYASLYETTSKLVKESKKVSELLLGMLSDLKEAHGR